MSKRTRSSVPRRFPPAVAFVALLCLCAMGSASLAQIPGDIVGGRTPTPAPTAAPTATPPPTSPRPRPTPSPGADPTPTPTSDPVVPSLQPGASPSPDPSGSPGPMPGGGGDGPQPEGVEGRIPAGFEVPRIPRTPGRNTVRLVRILERVTEVGIPLEEALVEGMGRFPVGGIAYYADDWWFPRFTPVFHLHEGLDIFADFGTPVRAPDAGVVTRVVDGAVGGIALWMRSADGTSYYFAHLQGYAPGIEVGRTVGVGTVLGYVGDSGNARGGAPHLHFEIHKPDAVPPKPYVDAWLDEAEANAAEWVASRVSGVVQSRQLLRTEQSLAGLLAADSARPGATPEYSILLALLDPVGGSVGVLPRLPLAPRRSAESADAYLAELVRMRMDGSVLTSMAWGIGGPGEGE